MSFISDSNYLSAMLGVLAIIANITAALLYLNHNLKRKFFFWPKQHVFKSFALIVIFNHYQESSALFIFK